MSELSGLAELAASPPPAAPALSAALEAELGALTAVAPRRPMRQLVILVCASLIYGAGLLAALTIRRDLDGLPVAWLVAAGFAWLLGFAIPCYLALVPRGGSVVPRAQLALAAAIVVSIGFVAMGLAIHPHSAATNPLTASLDYGWPSFARGHGCLELGLLTALVPVVAGALFLRGAMPVGSRWLAAALGAGGGCLGGLVLHMHCRIADAQHVGLVHGGVVGVAALLAAAIVPRVTR